MPGTRCSLSSGSWRSRRPRASCLGQVGRPTTEKAVTSGRSWNASIVAEVASWGQQKLTAHGLGAYIAEATIQGDFQRSVLGTVVLSLFVVTLNRVFWRPLYARAERKFRIA